MKLVELDKVTIQYPAPQGGLRSLFNRSSAVNALEDISLSLKSGDRLALIGLNGSGKSTLLRVMAGIYVPQFGTAKINGSTASLFNIGIGMKMDMTGRKNIILQGMTYGFSESQMLALMDPIIEFSELSHVIDNPINTYSQGMAMRLSFSVATAIKPDILLLDEWVGAGDRVFRKKAQARLLSLVEEARGFVMASHSSPLVRLHCTKAIWLENGRMKMKGPVDTVLDAFESDTPVKSDAPDYDDDAHL